MTVLAAWELRGSDNFGDLQAMLNEGLVFFLVSFGVAIWAIWNLLSRVELREESVSIRNPIGGRTTVEFRQAISAIESGRFGNSISLLYHPFGANGLIDTDDADTLYLPKVENQDDLLDHFRKKIPT